MDWIIEYPNGRAYTTHTDDVQFDRWKDGLVSNDGDLVCTTWVDALSACGEARFCYVGLEWTG